MLLQDNPSGQERLQSILDRTTGITNETLAQYYAKAARQRLQQQRAQQRAQQQAAASVAVPRGASYTGGSLAKPTGDVRDWIKQALIVSGHRGEHLKRGLYNMIMHESGGNPNAINNWDSNAAAGTPSIGLMQTIQPTFDAYAMKGYGNIYDPVSNIIAGLRYALSRYGADMVRSGGRRDANGNYIGY